jgi:hypothetical protein
VLILRAGVGVDRAYTPQQVSQKLGISIGRESRLERSGLTQLQSAGQSGSCGSSFVLLQVPAQDHLVAVSPVFVSTTSGAAGGAAQPTGARNASSGAGRVLAAARGPSTSTSGGIQNAAIHIATSTPALLTFGGGFGLLVLLAALSLAGRRLAEREQRMLLAAPATFVPASATAAQSVATADEEGPAAAPPSPVEDAAATWIPEEMASAAAVAPVEPTTPPSPTPPSPAPTSPAPTSAAPMPAVGERPVPPPPSGDSPANGDWLRAHRSQIAFALTAVAGGTLRMLARNRRKR